MLSVMMIAPLRGVRTVKRRINTFVGADHRLHIVRIDVADAVAVIARLGDIRRNPSLNACGVLSF